MRPTPASLTVRLALGVAALSCAACQGGPTLSSPPDYPPLETDTFGSMRNVFVVDGIWLGSTPAWEDLELAERRGVECVIDLSSPDEHTDLDVAATCARFGMEYVGITRADTALPADAAVDEVLARFRRPDRPRTLVFCGSGARCVALMAIHRAVVVGVPLERALDEARRAGLTPGELEEFVRAQVRRLAPSG
ncbi:MAG: hypothetical protein QF903_02705 [Planctomycetota bacterium]|jgi:protein tyrosine phosphatase (PTP) superfamily phosphohydrolase (DUF442 family)|nr:hypothetical protein [Planctomycetota bacterium]MDP6761232.1 hypothetical protein [Planctomycetota bacterium]MDP6988372.1 hypothetical protein [Planctomycetota bacterium]